LVVDEVLAVGDAEFQKKAIGKMQDVSRGEGRTVLFVSHNLQSIRALCQIGVLLDQGQTRCLGTINDVLDEYLSNVETNRLVTNAVIGDEDRTKDRSLDVQFLSCKQVNESGAYSTIDEIKLIVVVKGNKDRSQCRINCTICNIDGSPVGSLLSRHFFDIREGETKTFEYTIGPTNLAYGFYTISLYMGVGDVTTGLKDYDGVKDVLSFEIDKVSNSLYYGKWSRSWGEIYIPGGSLKEL
jgi:lipopolysaccharide transport system ATP-binding protein